MPYDKKKKKGKGKKKGKMMMGEAEMKKMMGKHGFGSM